MRASEDELAALSSQLAEAQRQLEHSTSPGEGDEARVQTEALRAEVHQLQEQLRDADREKHDARAHLEQLQAKQLQTEQEAQAKLKEQQHEIALLAQQLEELQGKEQLPRSDSKKSTRQLSNDLDISRRQEISGLSSKEKPDFDVQQTCSTKNSCAIY